MRTKNYIVNAASSREDVTGFMTVEAHNVREAMMLAVKVCAERFNLVGEIEQYSAKTTLKFPAFFKVGETMVLASAEIAK